MNNGDIGDLFDEFADDVYSFLVYYTKGRDVDDLVQETFIKAMKGIRKFRGQSSPKVWLLQIARNVAIDHFRRKQRREIPMDDLLLANQVPDNSSPEAVIEFKDTNERILELLLRLKPEYREVILYRTVFDLNTKEVGKVLGWSPNRVRVTLHRALKEARGLSSELK